MMMKVITAILLLGCMARPGQAFAPSSPIVGTLSAVGPLTALQSDATSSSSSSSSSFDALLEEINEEDLLPEVLLPRRRGIRGFFYNRFAGFVSGLVGFVTQGIAADDYELAELPPPYIPAIFGVVLLAGVGILTSSLGDVMDEEASLGLQSGARAKKEIERSRSSYFKRR
ncbi:hypothetical protein IV203_036293 [Nitzschia inconspicua]|uniref:Uncharacterized protein n=1 Tax=Nitzschia inconspicua TaxID=303405 RepID=A0A9K3P804_9STRA|nr:hypothetical protein IV203_006697 [Nitzschia inconspicua]KAG7361193.1 hypothetical protein IV203_036293 [Nitzschia inconspicua]